MYKLYDYIFTNMALSNVAILKIQKLLKRQNNLFIAFDVLMLAYMTMNNTEQREQSKKIKKLEKEVAALKRGSMEGE